MSEDMLIHDIFFNPLILTLISENITDHWSRTRFLRLTNRRISQIIPVKLHFELEMRLIKKINIKNIEFWSKESYIARIDVFLQYYLPDHLFFFTNNSSINIKNLKYLQFRERRFHQDSYNKLLKQHLLNLSFHNKVSNVKKIMSCMIEYLSNKYKRACNKNSLIYWKKLDRKMKKFNLIIPFSIIDDHVKFSDYKDAKNFQIEIIEHSELYYSSIPKLKYDYCILI